MVKPGYKQTEIGVIPQTWNIITFSKCFKILSNNTFSRAELNENSGTVKNIHYGDILVKYNSILNCSKESIPYISNLRKKATYMYLLNGDLIIADTAEDETVGKAVEISNIGNQKIVSGLHTIPCRSLSDDLFANGWLGHYINHSTYHNQLLPFITGTKVSAISKSSIAETLILVPPIPEQERIAEALSDVDELISSLEKLIEKYKSIKATCLQQMFPQKGETTPKMRLPGFTGAWEQRKVSDLAEKTYGGGTPTTSNEAYWNGDIPWIQSSDVVDGKLLGVEPRKWITQDGLNNSAAQLIPGNSIAIITRVGVGKLAFMPYSYATSQDFLSLSKLNAEPLFTVYACYKKLQSELNAVQGTSIKGITKDELLAKNIMVPRYAEQQQIGAFFKQLDNLITLHQRKLDKAKKIKQGMMQQLLTGKIRFV